MELPPIRDFVMIMIRKGLIKEVTFEVDLKGSVDLVHSELAGK